MFNNVTGSLKNRRMITYKTPPDSPKYPDILHSSSSLPQKTEYVKLPNIHSKHEPVDICCPSCNIHRSQGCSNNIKKNGNKIWYVLHNLVESIKTPILTNDEFEMISITMLTIIKSMPCKECAGHSLLWYNTTVKNNKKLYNKIQFIYELWKHHDDVTKRILIKNPSIIIKRLTWNDYKKQIEIDKITCTHNN